MQSAGVSNEGEDQMEIIATDSAVPSSSICNERLKEVALLGIENLAEVQIHDLFECHKCSMTFEEKDSYLQHLLSFHQKTTRRYRLGSTVGDGVIIKDGKYECQFCHKVFLERRRYNGHVGIHVRNYVRRAEDSPGQVNVQRTEKSPMSPNKEEMPSRISKMDALIEIAQNSIMENSAMEAHGNHASSPGNLNEISASEMGVGNLDHDKNFESFLIEQQMEDSITNKNWDHNLNQQDSQLVIMDARVDKTDGGNKVIDSKFITCLDHRGLSIINKQNDNASENSKGKDNEAFTVDGFDQSGVDLEGMSQDSFLPLAGNHIIPVGQSDGNSGSTNTMEQFKLDEGSRINSEILIGLGGTKDVSVGSNIQEIVMPTSEENALQSGVSAPSISVVQSLDCFPSFTELSDKV